MLAHPPINNATDPQKSSCDVGDHDIWTDERFKELIASSKEYRIIKKITGEKKSFFRKDVETAAMAATKIKRKVIF